MSDQSTRRDFLGAMASATLAGAWPKSLDMLALQQNAVPARPNIVFFLIDDLGYGDLGCYGNTFCETPNIDRLAREGMRFANAYASAPFVHPAARRS